MPTRRVLSLYGDRWVVGTGTPDGFLGTPIRQHFVMKKATDLMALLTPGQALAQAPGLPVYLNKTYFKDTLDAATTSAYSSFWNIFVAPIEPAVPGTFFRDPAGIFYRVRNTYLPAEGLVVCQADALPLDTFATVTFNTGAYDPVSDSYTTGSSVSNSLAMEIPLFYRFLHQSDDAYQKGDMALFVQQNLTPKRNDKLVRNGVVWVVLQVQPELDTWALHVRRA
jgi:hypothetical protein